MAIGAIGAVVLAACGGGGDDDAAESTSPPDTEAAPVTTEEPAPVTSEATGTGFDEIQSAVVQILAEGTIRDPEVGMTSNAGSGTGFIISPDGLAVTNNHVVTGAATLEVFIGGDTTESYNAEILGVSECNDLALIRIDADEPLPYLEWSDAPPTVGTEVYAAGFPLGDPEFTLTRGIISKAEASGDTSWASIDATIEHDANIQPGNSGGPLVDADGQVIGVNYAVSPAISVAQFFAIRSELAQDVVAELEDGDVESLGINGTAIFDEAAGLSGIWVSGVAAGSPAADVGMMPGDIVTSLNGLPMASDGTMADYCDAIRTAGDRPMQIEVLRYDTSEVLRGEIGGDVPLEVSFSFADEIEDDVEVDEGDDTVYTGYQTLIDDTGTITVDVPAEWTDVDTAPITLDDGTEIPQISAATSIQGYNESWEVPGMFFGLATGAQDPVATIADFAPGEGECATDDGLAPYDDGTFVGQFQIWSDCGGLPTTYVVVAASPADGSVTAVVAVQLTSEADLDALDQIFATFNLA
jgi:serine protease Do